MLIEDAVASGGELELTSPVLGSTVRLHQAGCLGLYALIGGDLARVWASLAEDRRTGLADRQGRRVGSAVQFREVIEQALPQFAAENVPELLRFGILELAD
jgi:hypothetical protein